MKKITLLFVALLSYFAQAQNNTPTTETKKFQLELGYGFNTEESIYEESIYNNPFNASLNYELKKWDAIDLSFGVRVFMFAPKSENKDNFSTNWAINPYVSSSYSFYHNKCNAYLGLGYYYEQSEFTTTAMLYEPSSVSTTIKGNGFTVTPGIKYFVYKTLFIDLNYTLINAKSNWDDYSESYNINLINVGVGIAL